MVDLTENSLPTTQWELGKENKQMLEAIIVVLLVLWLLGLITQTAQGFIHLLLVVALVIFVIRLLTGRKTF